MNPNVELFGKLFFQPIVLGILALFAFAVAFRGILGVDASVGMVWIATAIVLFGIERAMVSFNALLRDSVLVWAGISFFVFAVCSAVWLRDRDAGPSPSVAANHVEARS
jgi:hypothetical protein